MTTGLRPSQAFIFPVVLDDLSPQDEAIPRRLRELSWYSIKDGLTDDFVNTVKDLYKKNQTD
jgi:hypothetical protein